MSVDYQIRDEYVSRYSVLRDLAEKLENYLRGLVLEIPRIDSVRARAKDPDRYFAKATKRDKSGSLKYVNPRFAIQDQIGARITVLYLSDVEMVRDTLVRFIRFIENSPKAPIDDSSFGYFGHHFIFELPDEIVSDGNKDDAPEFFELQIKTLFQHAWSETHHDLGYKASRNWTSEERRQMAFTAAQAWGADKIFDELVRTLAVNDNDGSDVASD